MPRLSKRHIDALPVRDKEYFVWDDQLKGFGARVYPNGNKRYVAQTFRRGKTIRVQIGRHGALPFEEAKARARKIIADIDDGRNPNREKEAERLSPTVAQLAERFLEEYVPVHCKPRTRVEYVHAVKRYILPALGEIRVVALARDDVAALHHGMRDKPYQANRTLGVVSKMMNLAEAWGLRPDRSNPCYHIRKYKERKRERFLTAEELARLGGALDAEESFAPSAVTAFRLLLYTGARLMEIQTLKWEHIQGDRIHLPDSKTGAKTIPLNRPALEVLAAAKRVEGNPYVIHRHRRRRASDRSAEAVAAGTQGGGARRCAHPRSPTHVCLGGGDGGRELADGWENPRPHPNPDHRALRPSRRRSPAESVGAHRIVSQAGHGRIGRRALQFQKSPKVGGQK